ncbi:hypothetical protein HDU98_007805 [Podochytrium sp. JEL0797]|nr:hypothetical protein HDU98_007805 [Podochytrium sp. JEL0797]
MDENIPHIGFTIEAPDSPEVEDTATFVHKENDHKQNDLQPQTAEGGHQEHLSGPARQRRNRREARASGHHVARSSARLGADSAYGFGVSRGTGLGASRASGLGVSMAGSVMRNKFVAAVERAVGEETCQYEVVTEVYLEKRGLAFQSVSEWNMYFYFLGLILCLGCSNAWNGALLWGYGPVVVSALIAGLAYTSLVVIMSEMMTMLPFSGGMATFARSAFGPYIGYLVGTCEAWEYTLFGAQAVWQSGIVLATAAGVDLNFAPLFWIITVGVVAACHAAGTKWIMRFIALCLFINVSAMIILVLPSLPTSNVWNNALTSATFLSNPITSDPMNYIDPATGQNSTSFSTYLFPFGSNGVFQTIPTLMWTFLGIEAAPLCVEESVDFVKNAPRIALKAQATMWALVGKNPLRPPFSV